MSSRCSWRGDKHALAENPWAYSAWSEAPMRRAIDMPGVLPVQAYMCLFGKRHRVSKLHIKKPAKLLVSHSAFAKLLGMKCDGRHVHHRMIGEDKELKHA
eukprot:5922013-Heterocapsa_arctica.AAC.1